MSKIKVNQIEAATASTVSIPSGQTFDVSNATVSLPASAVTAHQAGLTITESQISDLGNYLTSVTNNNLSETVGISKGGTGLTALGTAGQVLKVNSAGNALEYAEIPGFGGILGVSDGGTGLGSLGSAGQVLKVNSGGTALEYAEIPGFGGVLGVSDGGTGLSALGTAEQVLKVNSAGTALEFGDAASGGGSAGAQDIPTADGTFTGEIVFMPNSPSPGDFITSNDRTVTYSAANNRITWTGDLVGLGNITATNLYRQYDMDNIGSGTWRGQGMRPIFWEKDGTDYTGRYFEVTEAVDDPNNVPGSNSNSSYIYKPSAATGFTGFYGEWKRLSATPDFKIDDVFLTSMGKNPSAVVVAVGNPSPTVDNDYQELPPNDLYDVQQIAGNTKTPKFRAIIQPAAGEFNHANTNGVISSIDFTRKTDHVGNFIYTVTAYEFDTTNSRYIIDFTVSKKFELPAIARMSDLADVQHSKYEGGTITFNAINPTSSSYSTQTDFDGIAVDGRYYDYTVDEIVDLLPASGSFTVGTSGGDVTLSYTAVAKQSSTSIRFTHTMINNAVTDNYTASIIATKVTTPTDGQVLAYEPKRQVWYPKSTVDGFDYATPTVTTSSAVDAVAGKVNLIDCSSNAVTVTLPSSPSRGDICHIIDASGDSGTYNITVNRNGNNINSAASNLTINTSHGNAKLVYTGISSAGWVKLYN